MQFDEDLSVSVFRNILQLPMEQFITCLVFVLHLKFKGTGCTAQTLVTFYFDKRFIPRVDNITAHGYFNCL